MLLLFQKGQESYSGMDSYKYVEPVIKKARTLYIVSPYIDSYYAKFLLRNLKGKKVFVISSSIEKDAKALFNGKRNKPLLLAYIVFTLLSNYFIAALGLYSSYLLFASSIVILLFVYLLVSKKKVKGLYLKVPNSFVHAKMYISEDEAISGSANLTYKGMHQNIEHITVMRSKEDVERMKEEFLKLWNSF